VTVPLKIGLIGCGTIGTVIARAIDEGEVPAVLTAVHDQEVDQLRQLAARSSRDLEDIYQDMVTGSTMGGSSGSPVVNSSSEVVGQLSGCCGYNCGDECDFVNNWTVDGALAYYWDSVSAFLDPDIGCTENWECDDSDPCTTDECIDFVCYHMPSTPCCGDGYCEGLPDEDCNNCPADCISGGGTAGCGNGTCEAGEDCNSCPADCRAKTGGKPSTRYCCDGDLVDCGNLKCSEEGWSCGSADPYCCGDGVCEGQEDPVNCAADCDCTPTEDPEVTCDDGVDNDCDGLTDGADPDCQTCLPRGAGCTTDAECCSLSCHPVKGTCK